MENMNERLKRLENKVDLILEILNGDLKKNCDKMAGHVDFVERVYDRVKNPLGFICDKIKRFSGGSDQNLLEDRLEDI
jgi:hypothetical protein